MNAGIDTKRIFKKPPFKFYFWQLLGATIFISLVLFIMVSYSQSNLIWAVGASSLASSAYVVFMHPHGLAAKPKNILIAYTLAVIIGEIIRLVLLWLGAASCLESVAMVAQATHHYWFAASISVISVMIIMAIFDIEHPPASGIALVIVVELCRHDIVIMIYAFMLLLCAIQLICRPYMRNLLR